MHENQQKDFSIHKGNRETDLRKGNSSGISSFQSGQIAVLIDELYHNLCDRPQPTEKIPQRITNVKEELRQPIQEPAQSATSVFQRSKSELSLESSREMGMIFITDTRPNLLYRLTAVQ